MQFLIRAYDGEGKLDKRMGVRPMKRKNIIRIIILKIRKHSKKNLWSRGERKAYKGIKKTEKIFAFFY